MLMTIFLGGFILRMQTHTHNNPDVIIFGAKTLNEKNKKIKNRTIYGKIPSLVSSIAKTCCFSYSFMEQVLQKKIF